MSEHFVEKRSEPRYPADRYSSVEFVTSDFLSMHLFPIYNMSSTGLGIIAREDSAAVDYLEVGKILEAKFRLSKIGEGYERCRVQIRHITKDKDNRFKNHYLIGLSILDSEPEV